MTVQGTIRGGLVILNETLQVPDGTSVTVLVPSTAEGETATAAERERQKSALAELLSMPNENPGDTFSGADHDRVLYGERQ